jgi:hypothetical protein
MANIVNIGQLVEAGYDIHIKNRRMNIRELGGRLMARVQGKENVLYVLNVNIAQRANCLAAWVFTKVKHWHARLGRVNIPEVWKMVNQELVHGLPHIREVDDLCEACMAGNQRRTSFLDQALWHAGCTVELVHGDLYKPITPATPSGNLYFLLIVDDQSRYMWISTLVSKDQAAVAIKDY